MNYFIYGSLREGMYNRKRFGESNFKKIAKVTLKGYKMLDLGSYPAVVKTGIDSDTITAEVTEIDDSIENHIQAMEYFAGYTSEFASSEGYSGHIFVMSPSVIGSYDEVESGDWVKHLSKSA